MGSRPITPFVGLRPAKPQNAAGIRIEPPPSVAVAIAVDATVVRLVLVPALMAMFAQWNWWLPGWLDRILPSVDFEKPLPKVDISDLVIIPEGMSTAGPTGSDIRMMVKSAAKLKSLAPHTVSMADPLAFSGCGPMGMPTAAMAAPKTRRIGYAGPPSQAQREASPAAGRRGPGRAQAWHTTGHRGVPRVRAYPD